MAVFYPDANPETSSVDGYAEQSGSNLTFATIRAGTGSAANSASSSISGPLLQAGSTNNRYSTMRRMILLFNTSSIPADATITSVVLSLKLVSSVSTLGTPDLVIDVPSPASNTDIANGDFNITGWAGSQKGRAAFTDFSAGNWTNITLTTDSVTKAGVTKLGGRVGWDFDDSTTGISWGIGRLGQYTFNSAESTDDPYLTVLYTTASARRKIAVIS